MHINSQRGIVGIQGHIGNVSHIKLKSTKRNMSLEKKLIYCLGFLAFQKGKHKIQHKVCVSKIFSVNAELLNAQLMTN